jgi:hypothetical protein
MFFVELMEVLHPQALARGGVLLGVYNEPSRAHLHRCRRMTGTLLSHTDAVVMSTSNADRSNRSLMSSYCES